MKDMFKRALLCGFMLIASTGMAQQMTQTVRGTIVDQDSKAKLLGARVVIIGSDPVIGSVADENGKFKLEEVPVGRHTIKITMIGYEDRVMPNLLVNSGKEVVINIELVEAVEKLEGLVVKSDEKNSEVQNEMSLVSARSFSVEETQRYAGAIDDPARMVSSFAGVNGNAEGNNDIVVRGNSPKGILWMLEGVQIPNPNHFANEGSTGGPINALNSNMLGNSDFFTGAFSPEYGNALSGVFDMKLRNGNNETREYAAGLSILGSEFTAEGPFKKSYDGSYLANYRYSSLALLDNAGIVDFAGVPKYQDASFKLMLPVNKKHTFSLFGLGGLSSIQIEDTDPDDEERIISKGEQQSSLGVIGLTHNYFINTKSYIRTTLSASGDQSKGFYQIPDNNNELYTVSTTNFSKSNLIAMTTLNHKFNTRNKLKTGVILTRQSFDMKGEYWSFNSSQLEPELNQSGSTSMIQAFASLKHRINQDLSLVGGLHYLYYDYTKDYSIEPRLALKWKFKANQSISLGAGMHSKPESISMYLAEQQQADGSFTRPNGDLGLSQAMHFVVGYDNMLTQFLHVKLEAYYQTLSDVPVEDDVNSTYSLLNSAGWYTTRNLVNEGTGRNYGIEATFERFFNKGLYYMTTLSLYNSLYTAKDGVERESRFNGNYVFNMLGGKEFRMGKPEKKRVFFTNIKLAMIGGQRYTPIDLQASIAKGDAVRDESNPYSAKGDDIIKLDVAVGIRRNKPKTTTEFKIDIQNATANEAVVNQYYEHGTQSIVIGKQLPLLPVISYKVSF